MINSRNVKSELILITLSLILILWAMPAIAITGGIPDVDAHPNVGVIIIKIDDDASMFCSGTLIAPAVFLTAGHCTNFLGNLPTGAELFISFSSDNAMDSDTWLSVETVNTHPDFSWVMSDPHDVGILILREEPGIIPATLPTEGFLDGLRAAGELRDGRERAKFTVVGYGTTLEWPPPQIIARDGVRRVATSEYLNLHKAWLYMSQNQAPGRDDSGTCHGDSGGPAFWTTQDGNEILVGTTSWGDSPCVATGIDYRVDIPDTLDFIALFIGSLAPRKPAKAPSVTWWGRIKSDY